YACLVMPAGVTLRGDGPALTTIKRLPSERGVDGILIANRGFDTETEPFAADGDLCFEDFTITDGDASPTRSLGDLLAMGNCENITVRRVHFGTHDQHGIDLCGVRGAHIYDCTGLNENDGSYDRSATIQIDG